MSGSPPPLLFDVTEEELDTAVREAGRDGKTLWPEVPEEEAASDSSSCISTRA